MSVSIASWSAVDGLLTIDSSFVAPANYKFYEFAVKCNGDYADSVGVPRNQYTRVNKILTTGHRISYIDLAVWPNGTLTFTVSVTYQHITTGAYYVDPQTPTVTLNNNWHATDLIASAAFLPQGVIQKPVTLTFEVPGTITTLTVPVTLTAEDNNAVTGYLVKETAAVPAVNDPAWAASIGSIHVVGYGDHTLYAWAKDADGNVSDPVSAVVTVLPPPPPFATPKGGKFQTGRVVTLTDPAGGIILYTTDGSDPRSVIATFDGVAQFFNGSLLTNGDVQ